MAREKMMNKIVKALGFENLYTVWFCTLCETEVNEWNDRIIEIAFDNLKEEFNIK